jgi:hypothetical protein
MNAHDLLFKTARFNLIVVKDHFINPCCFGEDLAVWLRDKLVEKGVKSSAPSQEDWGWYLNVNYFQDSYFLGMSGNADQQGGDKGEWRIIVKKKRSLWQWLSGKGKILEDDCMLRLIEEILTAEPDFREIHRESHL